MSVASALVAGNDALPALAEQRLAQALEKTGAAHGQRRAAVSSRRVRSPRAADRHAVARAARCTQVAGGIAAGVFTDSGWVLDRPAAAVMVFAGDLSLDHRETGEPRIRRPS
jgi:hypothetical protein